VRPVDEVERTASHQHGTNAALSELERVLVSLGLVARDPVVQRLAADAQSVREIRWRRSWMRTTSSARPRSPLAI
jgi:hypothetical protein